MITHECLPLEPQDGEVFQVPEGVVVHVGAFIGIRDAKSWIGEATGFDKVSTMANLWMLQRVITPNSVTLTEDMELEVHTIVKSADHLVFKDGLGWIVSSYNPKPVQETVYSGILSPITSPVFVAGNYTVYEVIGFLAKGKGVRV
jgi:hypothetical protein